ncbi:NADH-quinone oxidoreductase subunit NuoK [Nannocystaceae bacterium ST9]
MTALPVTHFLYLAFALFVIGLAAVLLRRSLIAVLGGIQIMIASTVLLLCAYARHHGDVAGQASAVIVALVGLLELAVAVALVLRASSGASGARALIDDWTGSGEAEPEERPR